jgi:hypothetical protein
MLITFDAFSARLDKYEKFSFTNTLKLSTFLDKSSCRKSVIVVNSLVIPSTFTNHFLESKAA